MNIKPLPGYIVLKYTKKTKTDSGILLAEDETSEEQKNWEVVAVGHKKLNEKDNESILKPGDIVLFTDRYEGVIKKEGDTEYLIIEQDKVAGIVEL